MLRIDWIHEKLLFVLISWDGNTNLDNEAEFSLMDSQSPIKIDLRMNKLTSRTSGTLFLRKSILVRMTR